MCALLPWLTFCWDPCPIDSNIEPLKTVVQELRNELARFQRAACQRKNSLNDIIGSLPAELSLRKVKSRIMCDRDADSPGTSDIGTHHVDVSFQ